MSRGLGKVQAGLLAIIEQQQKVVNTYQLAQMFYQPNVEGQCSLTEAQVKATYRALCSLAKRGKIERRSTGRGRDGFIWWSRLGSGLTIEQMKARADADRAIAAAVFEQKMRAAMGDN